MNEPFTQNIEISLYDTDMNAKISIQNIVKYFLEGTFCNNTIRACSEGANRL